MRNTTKRSSKRTGFSLIELVVVVLIMGILAAVAAPKIFDKISDARDSSTKQSLAVLRSAIELYRANEDVIRQTRLPTCRITSKDHFRSAKLEHPATASWN